MANVSIAKRVAGRFRREIKEIHRRPAPQEQGFTCPVCGNGSFTFGRILWPRLVREWQIPPDEAKIIDHREGTECTKCRANFRSMVLADAIMTIFGCDATLEDFVKSREAAEINILEVNTAGSLNPTLKKMPRHQLGEYPKLDMLKMPFAAGAFDLIVHSDTLEHVPNPIAALAECRRVLKVGGALCYTIPIIPSRMSRSREGLEPSYHGGSEEAGGDWQVQTEYGADAWTHPLRAGFTDVTFHALDYPTAFAIISS